MAAPYSNDLREKAVAAVDRGEKKAMYVECSRISRNTLDLWLKAREKRGTVKAKQNYRRGPEPKVKELEEFRQFALQAEKQKNGGRTQKKWQRDAPRED